MALPFSSPGALRIDVEEAFTHCPKAFLRSQLWGPERYVDRGELLSPGEVMLSVVPSLDPEAYDAERTERYARRGGLY